MGIPYKRAYALSSYALTFVALTLLFGLLFQRARSTVSFVRCLGGFEACPISIVRTRTQLECYHFSLPLCLKVLVSASSDEKDFMPNELSTNPHNSIQNPGSVNDEGELTSSLGNKRPLTL